MGLDADVLRGWPAQRHERLARRFQKYVRLAGME